MFKLIVKSLVPFFVAGAVLQVGGAALLLKAERIRLLADEAALKASFASRGASGLKICLKCKNVVNTQQALDEYFVPAWESQTSKFDPWTDIDVFMTVDNLAHMS